LIPFSLKVNVKSNGKKELKNIPKFSEITHDNYKQYVDCSTNAMAIRMGCTTTSDSNEYVVLIDIDNKEDTQTVKNGIIKWKELIKYHTLGLVEDKIIETPTQKTGNHGLHYLFKVTKEKFDLLPASITEISINNIKYSIDFKGKNQFALVEPTNYDGKFYQWIVPYDENIANLPDWLYKILIDQKKHSVKILVAGCKNKNSKTSKLFKPMSKKTIKDIVSDDTDIDEVDDIDDIDDEIFRKNKTFKNDFLEEILSGITGYDDNDIWTNVGMGLKNESSTTYEYFDLWDKWSSKSKTKYEGTNKCKQKWNCFKKIIGGYSIKYLLSELKICDRLLYAKIYKTSEGANRQ
jgi:hypothetical protein